MLIPPDRLQEAPGLVFAKTARDRSVNRLAMGLGLIGVSGVVYSLYRYFQFLSFLHANFLFSFFFNLS